MTEIAKPRVSVKKDEGTVTLLIVSTDFNTELVLAAQDAEELGVWLIRSSLYEPGF